jgi:hypothetical protein
MADRSREIDRRASPVKEGGPTAMNMPGLVSGRGRPLVMRQRMYGPYMKLAIIMPKPWNVMPRRLLVDN